MASLLHLNNPDWTEIHASTTVTFQERRFLFHQLDFYIFICKMPQNLNTR